MNSKTKNILLEGILIGTLALTGCKSAPEVRAKVTELKFVNSADNSTSGIGYVTAQDETKPYTLKIEACGCSNAIEMEEFYSTIKIGDSISFKDKKTMQLGNINVFYRPRSDLIEENSIYGK
jgi:hypothetical protein